METLNKSKEAEILSQIRNSEKKAEEIIESGIRQKEVILQDAVRSSSELLNGKKEELAKLEEKKIINFRNKAESAKEEKLKEGRETVAQMKKKAAKNLNKAVEYVMKEFEATVNDVSLASNKKI